MRKPHRFDYCIIKKTLSRRERLLRKNFDFLNDAMGRDKRFKNQFGEIRRKYTRGVISGEAADKTVLIAFDDARKRIATRLGRRVARTR